MDRKRIAQRPHTLWRKIWRYRWLLIVAGLAVCTLLAITRFVIGPAFAASSPRSSHHVGGIPAASPTHDYTSLFSGITSLWPTTPPLDAEQQRVRDYLHAHGVIVQPTSAAPWDPAVQAVQEYLRAHSK